MCQPGQVPTEKMALPIFSTDTVEEAESLCVLFGTRPRTGALKGRYIVAEINRASDRDALDVIDVVAAKMEKAYNNLLERKKARGHADKDDRSQAQ